MRSFLSLALVLLAAPLASAATPFSRLASSAPSASPSVIIENFPTTSSSSSSSSAVTAASPVLYITFHGGTSGVNVAQRYDLSGNALGDLYSNTCSSSSLRSMAFLPDNTLLIANADDSSSRVLQFSACQADGTRTYIKDYATSSLDHPYGVTSGNGNLYVSSQNINTVNAYSLADQSFQGVVDNLNPDQIRGLAFDSINNILYIADKDANTVQAWDVIKGAIDASQSVAANDPIGLHWEASTQKLYIGSNGDNSVIQWNPATKTKEQTFTDATNLQHPAGITVNGDALYVISQTTSSLLQFSISSGALVSVLASNLPDSPEQILLSNC